MVSKAVGSIIGGAVGAVTGGAAGALVGGKKRRVMGAAVGGVVGGGVGATVGYMVTPAESADTAKGDPAKAPPAVTQCPPGYILTNGNKCTPDPNYKQPNIGKQTPPKAPTGGVDPADFNPFVDVDPSNPVYTDPGGGYVPTYVPSDPDPGDPQARRYRG